LSVHRITADVTQEHTTAQADALIVKKLLTRLALSSSGLWGIEQGGGWAWSRSSLFRRSRCRSAQARRDRQRLRSPSGRPYLHQTCQRAVSNGWRQRWAIPGRDRARHRLRWIWRHESGTYVRFTDSGAALFAW